MVPQEYEIYCVGPGDKRQTQIKTMKQYIKPKKSNTHRTGLCADNLLANLRFPQSK